MIKRKNVGYKFLSFLQSVELVTLSCVDLIYSQPNIKTGQNGDAYNRQFEKNLN